MPVRCRPGDGRAHGHCRGVHACRPEFAVRGEQAQRLIW